MDSQSAIKLDEVRRAVQELRKIHHRLRHPYQDGCAECVSLAWLKGQGF
jgi:hypothetical protein